MSNDNSPIRFSGRSDFLDLDGGFDPTFSAEINNKMRVPKRIHVAGELSDGDEPTTTNWSLANGTADKLAMQVPDRIILTGHDHHVGAKALPRELQLENMIMPPDPEIIRIQTPPRSITVLDQPQRKSRSNVTNNIDVEDDTLIVENNQARFLPNASFLESSSANGTTIALRNNREGSVAGYYESDDIQAELEHLRDQMSRLNKRLLTTELDMFNLRERQTYLMVGALLYFTMRACSWIFRSGSNR